MYLPPNVIPWYPFVIVRGVVEKLDPLGSPESVTDAENESESFLPIPKLNVSLSVKDDVALPP